jgi:hypothetical protein
MDNLCRECGLPIDDEAMEQNSEVCSECMVVDDMEEEEWPDLI